MSTQAITIVDTQRTAPAHPGSLPGVDTKREQQFATDVDHWLANEATAANAVQWAWRGAMPGDPVASVDHLAQLVRGLHPTGSWAVVTRPNADLWAQCMRVEEGWIVEVNGIPGPECFVRRVQGQRGGWRERLTGRRTVRSGGQLMAIYVPQDVFADAGTAADVMWAWLRGRLPEGFELREV